MREFARWLVLVALMALATPLLGWWAVPVLGAVWGVARGLQKDAPAAGLAAVAAWGILLGSAWARGPAGELTVTMGDILNVPAILLVIFTLLFAGLLAASAAGLAAGVRAALTALAAEPAD